MVGPHLASSHPAATPGSGQEDDMSPRALALGDSVPLGWSPVESSLLYRPWCGLRMQELQGSASPTNWSASPTSTSNPQQITEHPFLRP